MLRHEALTSQVFIDLHELLCVLECSVLVFLQHSLFKLGLEGEVGKDEFVGLGGGAVEVTQNHDHVSVLAQSPLGHLLLKVLYHVVYLLRLR